MKSFPLMAITALTLSGAALAQTQSYSSSQTQSTTSQTQTQAAPSDTQSQSQAAPSQAQSAPATSGTMSGTTSSTTSTTSAPAPKVSEQKVDLTTEPGPPADLRAARTEAVNALAWAKSEGCRSDPSPRDCVKKAQDDYRATMARLGGERAGGTVSASGTSQAGASNARADRN